MVDVDLKQAVITDVEYHYGGELLTIWVRAKDGKLYSLIPVEYRFGILECPYAEEYHGGN